MKAQNKENDYLKYKINDPNSYSQYLSSDYPVNVYYVDFSEMFMGYVRHHWHKEMEIDFVKEGSVLFKIGEEEITVEAGNAIIINSNRIHTIEPIFEPISNNESKDKKKCIMLSILFSTDYIFGEGESFVTAKYREQIANNYDFPYGVIMKNSQSHKQGLACINQILNDNLNKAYGYELMTKSNLCRFWIWMLELAKKDKRSKKKSPIMVVDEDRVKQGILFIHDHINENITLEKLAESVNLSKSECCRCFKRSADLTPFEYIMQHRIYIAAQMMQHGDSKAESINEMAAFVGFNNASYFNKVFKNYMGTTPTKYRESIKLSHRDSLNPFGIPLSRN